MKHFVWWHRLLGHNVYKRDHIWGTAIRYECNDCDVYWDKSLL